VMIGIGFGLFNALVENDPKNQAVPELAESWEAKPGAASWVFNLRKGVQFHNGKEFTADDAIFSLNLHRGESKSGVAGPMKMVKDIKKLGSHQIQIDLIGGDADFAYLLTDYHILMVPDEHTDWSKPIGTGAFTLESFQAGVRAAMKSNKNFWKKDRGFFDAIELTVINDSNARMAALMSGQIDVMNRADPKTVALIEKSPIYESTRSAAGWHPVMAMRVDKAPYDNADMRRAMKHAIDRKQLLKTMFNDYGVLGNDHPIPKADPFYHPELPQTEYDPDKARFHFKKAGVTDPKIVLQASDASFNGAVDMGTLYQASAGKCDIKIEVKKEPADGFWSNVWLKGDFVTGYWGGRPAATMMLGVCYQGGANWNETHMANATFDKLLADARAELDPAKRKKYIWDLQELLNKDGGAVIPVFRDFIDGHSKKLGGLTPHGGFDLANGRFAEKAWFKA
jgi:peptide/nickel transport system substrate-binding protein